MKGSGGGVVAYFYRVVFNTFPFYFLRLTQAGPFPALSLMVCSTRRLVNVISEGPSVSWVTVPGKDSGWYHLQPSSLIP